MTASLFIAGMAEVFSNAFEGASVSFRAGPGFSQ